MTNITEKPVPLSQALEASETFGSIFEAMMRAGPELSLKTIAALQANTEAHFSHFLALIEAKSPLQAMELQWRFLHKLVDVNVEHIRKFQALTSEAVADVSSPTTPSRRY
ncbi:phasin family protein [Sinorhizobium americanum]|uniref:Methyl-accepting chemotaxis protein n=1 Tax=Sinorhizobium americanum TaxID=194963 RepID=A0A1L3LTT0_9HYPH|nr:phasin family protein [Sinorhizobium americanum]APG93501.1 methyl-accepting chemotaxis protein [Sinorhizobium americanum]OAP44166.1 hypothetical protein ATC00_24555 [Sinorhizobium americanum]